MTIRIEEINHDVTTGETGDYFRLLVPGDYHVTAFKEGYEHSDTKPIKVKDGLETLLVNFTLKVDESREWSKSNDFELSANLEARYLTNDEMKAEIGQMENVMFSPR